LAALLGKPAPMSATAPAGLARLLARLNPQPEPEPEAPPAIDISALLAEARAEGEAVSCRISG
jgi:hypothetical protein